tara:strand:+ start:2598 stop:3563 length:966 start_codon:yes stop_codon:yes gene_type:complete
MNFTTFLKKTNAYLIVFIGFSLVTSCGSYQYVGVYEDGIYGDSETQDYNANTTNDVSESVSGNSYYNDYFKGKSNEYNNNQETVFTDVEDYDSSYSPNNTADNSYAGWGQNSDSNVIINIQSRPNYGMGWGWNNWGWNNWGWNRWGWSNWGWNAGWNWGYPNYYGYWNPFFYNGWNAPYLGGYGVGFYTPYRSQNIAYVNGNRNNALSRNSSYRSSSLSNRSALGTVSRVRRNNAESTRTSTRQYNTTRPTVRTTTTRSIRTTSKPRSTTSSSRATTNTSRTTPRSSSYSRSRSSSSSSYSRSGGSSSSPRRSTSTRPRRN